MTLAQSQVINFPLFTHISAAFQRCTGSFVSGCIALVGYCHSFPTTCNARFVPYPRPLAIAIGCKTRDASEQPAESVGATLRLTRNIGRCNTLTPRNPPAPSASPPTPPPRRRTRAHFRPESDSRRRLSTPPPPPCRSLQTVSTPQVKRAGRPRAVALSRRMRHPEYFRAPSTSF